MRTETIPCSYTARTGTGTGAGKIPLHPPRSPSADTLLRSSDRLIIFTRYPRPGVTKTRLIPLLGRRGAAGVQRQLTERLLARVAADPMLMERTTVQFTGGTHRQVRDWLGRQPAIAPQQGNGLGRRMLAALARARGRGGGRIILVGADCPALDPALIRCGFNLLAEHDITVGPCRDGGYYLIGIARQTGLTRIIPLFADMAWGSSRVLEQTLARIDRLRLSCALLPTLVDIDRPEDLAYLHHHPCSQ